MKNIRLSTAMLAIAAVSALPVSAFAEESSSHRTFDGTVVHVSTFNVKVRGLEAGKQQILSFVYVPKLGKASPIYKIHSGEFVRVTYDQKGVGARHVDKISPHVNGKAMKM